MMRILIILMWIIIISCKSNNDSMIVKDRKFSILFIEKLFPKVDSFTSVKHITYPFFLLDSFNTISEQFAFQSYVMESATIQLIPNMHNRDKDDIKAIKNITGVAHFFLDHDLTSGFVHSYTLNFFNKLSADDFVLKFTPSSFNKNIGEMHYIRKGSMMSTDKLGKNIAYFRPWTLSENI